MTAATRGQHGNVGRRRAAVAFTLAAGLVLAATAGAAGWTTRARTDSDPPGPLAVALVENEHAERLELLRDSEGALLLRLVLESSFDTFADASCPTFQVDTRLPLHYFKPGAGCVVEDRRVTFTIGAVEQKEAVSLILHRLINGSKVSFRYATSAGRYRESEFGLRASKRAIKQAIGPDTRVRAE